MTELLPALLVLGCMILVLKFVTGGGKGRIGRPPKGLGTRFQSPADSPLPAAGMGAYAMGSAVTITGGAVDGQTGILIGAVVAIFLAFRAIERFTVAALGVVGFLCAAAQMVFIVRGQNDDGLASIYRIALVGLVFFSFLLATLLFNRASALKGERGLCLLGIVDIVGFLAHPTGSDLFHLDQVSHLMFVTGACAFAFAIGWAVSEATLGVVGLVVVALSIATGGPNGWLGVIAAVAAVCFTTVVRAFTGRAGV